MIIRLRGYEEINLHLFSSSFPLFLPGSDFHNGIVGFSLNSLMGQVLDEDSENRTALLYLQRQENR